MEKQDMDIYAHRGVHEDGIVENTIEAFRLTRSSGADGFETDLRHTAEGEVVLFHDHAVDGVPVADLSLREVRRMTGVAVPTLQDLLDAGLGMAWNAEIKTRRAWALARERLSAWRRDVIVTSFIHEIAVDAAACGLRSGILQASSPMTGAAVPSPRPLLDIIVCDWKVVDGRMVDEHREAGWRFGTYGTTSPFEHAQAVGMGMSLVITDHVGHGVAASRLIPS